MTDPNRAPCGHVSHLRKGINLYGWNGERTEWEACRRHGLPQPPRIPAPRPKPSVLLKVSEVAVIMRCSKMTVYRLVNGGVLPAVRVGKSIRVIEQAVVDYLEGNPVVIEDETA